MDSHNLIKSVNSRYLWAGAGALKVLFNDAILPLPDEGEYFDSNDSGFLVFLEREGLIVRIRSRDARTVVHPYVLQPLATRHLGLLKVEFMPGVAPCPSEWKWEVALKKLKNDGIDFWDAGEDNTGTLPNGQPVVIDIGAVEKLSFSTTNIKNLLALFRGTKESAIKQKEKDAQAETYGSLRESVNEAWPEDQKAPDPQKFRSFLELCRTQKTKKILVSGWCRPDSDEYLEDIQKISTAYAMRSALAA